MEQKFPIDELNGLVFAAVSKWVVTSRQTRVGIAQANATTPCPTHRLSLRLSWEMLSPRLTVRCRWDASPEGRTTSE
jgi:hypothetical protein